MIGHDLISPYWGLRCATANGYTGAAQFYYDILKDKPHAADFLQLCVDFCWDAPTNVFEDGCPQWAQYTRLVFWAVEAVKQGALQELPPILRDVTLPTTSGVMSHNLRLGLAFVQRLKQEDLPIKDLTPPCVLIEELPKALPVAFICPYDCQVSLVFEKIISQLGLPKEQATLAWYYLMNENGGQKAWRLLTRDLNFSIQLPQWVQWRERIAEKLIMILGLLPRKSGSRNRKKEESLSIAII